MDDDYSSVHPEIKPFIDEFVKEAEIRGYQFDLSSLKIDFGTPAPGANATTYYDHNQIIIDKESKAWIRNPSELVFHELGHLLLHRKHDDTRLNGFFYKSIMCAEGSVKFTGWRSYRRQYYLDELFDPDTPFPAWAKDDYEGIETTEEEPLPPIQE